MADLYKEGYLMALNDLKESLNKLSIKKEDLIGLTRVECYNIGVGDSITQIINKQIDLGDL